jgi:hypothetical protein
MDVLPDGKYLVEINDVQYIENDKGTEVLLDGTVTNRTIPLIKLWATVVSGPYTGNQIFTCLVMRVDNYKVLAIILRWMEALGVDAKTWQDDLRSTGTLVETVSKLFARRVIFVVRHQEGYPKNEKPKVYRNYVKWIEAAPAVVE